MYRLLESRILTPVPHVHHNHLVRHEYNIHLVHFEDHVHDEQLVHLEDHLHQRARGPLSSVMFASVDVDNLPCVGVSFYLEIIRVGVSFYFEIIRVGVSFYPGIFHVSVTGHVSTTTYKQNNSTTQNIHKIICFYVAIGRILRIADMIMASF